MTTASFISKKDYEQIKLAIRRHFITFVPYVFLFLLLCVIPPALYFFFGETFSNIISDTIWSTVLILATSVYYLSIYLFFYSFFVAFYLDMWIATNDRLLDVHQTSLFGRTISELDLFQIQDAESDIRGFFPSLFNYGNVTLQTAGAVPKFILYNVPKPHQLREAILDLAAEDKKYHTKT